MKFDKRNILATAALAALVSIPLASGSLAASDDEVKKPANAEEAGPCGPGMGMRMGRHMGDRQGMGMMEGRRHGMGMMEGRRHGMGEQGFMQRFGAIDENSDDRIGADEAASQRESVFLAMDSDDNGELTMEEYMAVRMGPGPRREDGNQARQKQRQDAKKSRFETMDTDGSGNVSKAEWMLAGKKRYEAADLDGDGLVTPWEFRSQHRRN